MTGRRSPVAIGMRLYRGVARALPHEFRRDYGADLVQVAEEAIGPIWRDQGLPGLARLLADIAVRVAAEHGAELRQDVRYGLRMLAGSPGFAALAVISLGLGISVGTSGYSIVHSTILRNVPEVHGPDELVTLRGRTSYPNYLRYSERSDLFTATLAYAPAPFGVSSAGRSERIWGHLVTPSYFSTLGVRPAIGRFFDPKESSRPVVVSYRFWTDHLGADPGAVGKALSVNGQPCMVIGVGPKDFLGPAPLLAVADLWLPLSVDARLAPELANNVLERRDAAIFQMVGRLKPGVKISRAQAELDTVARQLEETYGDPDRNRSGLRVLLVTGGKMIPIRPEKLGPLISSPTVLAGLMLLIACANVANMMLARAAGRQKEIAVRLALGASRARLIRQLLTESMLLALGAGALGFVLTSWLMRLFNRSDAMRMSTLATPPVSVNMDPDGRVLLFAIALAIATGLAFGLVPAFRATRTDLTTALKDGGSVPLRKFAKFSLRNILVLSQVAASVTLVLLTAALAAGYSRSMGLEVGFDPNNLFALSVDPVRDGYSGQRAADFFRKLLERVQSLPSVTAASLTDTSPMWAKPAWVSFSSGGAVGGAAKVVVGKDYFDTLGAPILLGRGFHRTDETNDATAVIINERLARDFWNGANPLGRRIEIGRGIFQVVGVVRKTKISFALGEAGPEIYFPLRPENFAQPSINGMTLMVRTTPGFDALSALRREVSAMDTSLTPFNTFRMRDQIDQLMFVGRIGVYFHGSMGLFGLILAAIGLTGMTAYSVARRRREIGIRVALGARSADVLALVMREGAVLIALGTVIGLAGAWASTRLLSFVMQVTTNLDLAVVVAAPLLLAALALTACYVPARQSLRVDPAMALRQE